MATVDKNFRIKNGLVVEGSTATVNGSNILTENSTEFIQDTAAALITGGTHTNISVSYNDAAGTLSLTGAVTYTDEQAQDAIGNNLGTGLSYNDTTGAISVNTSTIQARVANVSDTEIGYLDGVTSAIQTQLDGKSATGHTHTASNITDFNEAAQDAVGGILGSGLTYSDPANTITVDSTVVQLRVANVSDTEIGYLDGVTSAIQTQVDAKLPKAGGTMSGDIAMGTNKITGLGTPTSDADAATKAYVDSASQGIDWKASVRAATTAAVTLSTDLANGSVIDGVTLVTGNRIHVKNQTSGAENGIYVVQASGAPVRATDADTAAELTASLAVFVEEGTANADAGWTLTNNGTITVGTTALTFTQFTGLGQITAGTGLSKSGNTISVDTTTIQARVANVSDTEIGYLDGVTSAIQTQLDAKLASATAASTYAPIASPTFTGTVSGVTKSHVGLGNVDNTSDANKPVSTATQTALDLKANLAGPTFTGTVVLPSTTSIGNVSATDLGYVDGVTSAIQTQLDAKASTASLTNVTNGTTAFTEVNVNSVAKQIAATTGNVVTAAATTAYSWAKASYRSGEFLVKSKNGSHTEVSKIMLTLDSSDNIYLTEYGMSSTSGTALQTVSADISGTDVRIRVTPANNNTEILITGTLLV